jgi:hypothetical protein
MKYLYLSLVLCTSISGIAQNYSFEQIISKNTVIRCEDVQLNAYSIIKGLHERNEIDSLYRFIDYWETKCNVTEMSFRLTQLLDIDQGRFNPDKINGEWIDFLLAYKTTSLMGPAQGTTPEELKINQQLDHLNTFLHEFARNIATPVSTDAQLLLAFYASKYPTFTKIAEASPEESRLSEFYHHERRQTERAAVMDIFFNIGYYHPFGKMERFGGHPIFGVGYGYSSRRHSGVFQFDIHAGPSRDEYTIVYNGAKISHRQWTGMYMGIEYYYHVIKREQFSFAFSPGIGYDRISALTSEDDDTSVALRSLNLSFGLQGKYRYNDDHYVGIQVRLNRADFNNPGGTTLNGGYVTIKAFWSFTDDLQTSMRRKSLK